MLSKRDNLLETIHGGHPDRYVNQYDFFSFIFCSPLTDMSLDDQGRMVDEWGVTMQVGGQPGAFPIQSEGYRVVTDIEHWKG